MTEEPIERLNYYNGQRLEAGDLRVEQEYHIRVRRWLNKSLFSPGIGEGLEVRSALDAGGQATESVIVSPGLALDAEGREIILLEEQTLPVLGQASNEGEVTGNYLTIQYREQKTEERSDGCAPHGGRRAGGGQVAWGGPARLREAPVLGWCDVFPHASSGKIVLAQVELDSSCKVRHVYAYPRQYVGPTSVNTVRQYALEGERHIDHHNPGRIYFHVRGRQPNAVTLYLRAERFSTLFYTELGWHEHSKMLVGQTATLAANGVDDHTHAPSATMKTRFDAVERGMHTTHVVKAEVSARQDAGAPGPSFWDILAGIITGGASIPFSAVKGIVDALKIAPNYPPAGTQDVNGKLVPQEPFFALRLITRDRTGTPPISAFVDLKPNVGISVENGEHEHTIVGKTGSPEDKVPTHTHPLDIMLTIDKAGVDQIETDYKARSGKNEAALTYITDLQIYIGRADQDGVVQRPSQANCYTTAILTQLKNLQPTVWDTLAANNQLGSGGDRHPLVANGTGAIRIDLLAPTLSFPEGEYYIEFQVASGGGRILYNLYVE